MAKKEKLVQESYDGMPEPMPSKNQSPKPKRKKKETLLVQE
jgi:hypothetical protein